MAFLSLPSVISSQTKRCDGLRSHFPLTSHHFKSSFLPCVSAPAKRRARTNHPNRFTLCAEAETNKGEQVPEDEKEFQKVIEKLVAKPLRWSDIPFSNVEEELKAIDEYEREEELDSSDVWPKFLRGAAYEYWGQPRLALAQYAKTDQGSGLRRVPELWERRAYNSFKVGKVGEANAYFDISLQLFDESCGNELHFVHWFYSNFKDYIPKWNGPSAPVQRGICKYCVGQVEKARESFMPEILLKQKDMEHAILWFLASSAKMEGKDGLVLPRDAVVAKKALTTEFDWNPRLRLFIDVFLARGEGVRDNVSQAESKLSEAIRHDEQDDVLTYLYLAVYNDAFRGDEEERDRALDMAIAIGSTVLPNDTENFLFCAAKNRISAPPDAKSVTVSEKTT